MFTTPGSEPGAFTNLTTRALLLVSVDGVEPTKSLSFEESRFSKLRTRTLLGAGEHTTHHYKTHPAVYLLPTSFPPTTISCGVFMLSFAMEPILPWSQKQTFLKTWYLLVDSNHRPQPYQDCALTN